MLDEIGASYLLQLTAPMKADIRSNLLFLKDAKRVRECITNLIGTRRGLQAGPEDLLGKFVAARHRNGEAMPDQQIVDEVVSILTAGHETVASALKSVWYLIARDPAVAQAVSREADSVMGDSEPSIAHVASLRYTKQVVKEALRLFPPAWVISHIAERGSRIGGHQIPAGSKVFVCPYLIHRHPDFWPEPEIFDPARFAAGNAAIRHSHAYIPYGIGPRNCIGDDLSMQEMLLHVATISRAFKVVHVDGAPGDFAAGFLLRAHAPVHLRLEHRR
jgi:cytochrome P450